MSASPCVCFGLCGSVAAQCRELRCLVHWLAPVVAQVPGAPPGGYDHNYVLFNQGPQARFITKNGQASLK